MLKLSLIFSTVLTLTMPISQ